MTNALSLRVNSEGLVSRRRFLHLAGGTTLGGLGWAAQLGALAGEAKKQGKSCILLWMAGGPSQFETFDPKPGAETQGPTRAISSQVGGIRVAEHWPRTAGVMGELAVLRSLSSKEGNHGRATYLLHTSYPPSGGIVHPSLGAQVSHQIGAEDADLPNFVSINGPSIGPSFLGVRHAPFIVTDPSRPPDNLELPAGRARLGRRLDLLRELEEPQTKTGTGKLVQDHRTLYTQTARLALSPKTQAFRLDREPVLTRTAYGPSAFGQGCLMARRLIEAGVAFVEVQSSGWDTHGSELPTLTKLIPPVDRAAAALITDLKARGMLGRTLVIWMGEFGRTPKVNLAAGREHYPSAFNAWLAGAGIKGGCVVGATDKLGVEIADRPVTVPDLFCTFCKALGIDPRYENQSDVGRPLQIVEGGQVVKEVF